MNNATPSIITLTILSLACGSVAAADSASFPLSIIGSANVLGIDQILAAKIFAVAAIIQGTLFVLAPMPQAKWYGWDKPNPAAVQNTVEFIGGSILATGIAPYCMLFHGTDYVLAVGITCTFWSFFFLRSFLNDTYKKDGMPIEKFVAVFAPAFIAVYAGFTAQKWALDYFKTLDALYALIALHEIFLPESAVKLWSKDKLQKDEKPVGLFLIRTLGFFSLEYHIQAYCLACGVEVTKAMAYGAFAGLAYFLSSLFITKDIPNVAGFRAGYFYVFWLIFFSSIIPAMLVDE